MSKNAELYNDAVPEGVRRLTAAEKRRHAELGVTGRYRSVRLPPHLWEALQWRKDYRTPLGRRVRSQYKIEWAAADRIEALDIEAEDRTEYLPADQQRAYWEEVGFEFYQSPEEPVAPYPATDYEASGTPAALSADQVLQEYKDAYLYGKGGTYLNSPGAQYLAEQANRANRRPRIPVAA